MEFLKSKPFGLSIKIENTPDNKFKTKEELIADILAEKQNIEKSANISAISPSVSIKSYDTVNALLATEDDLDQNQTKLMDSEVMDIINHLFDHLSERNQNTEEYNNIANPKKPPRQKIPDKLFNSDSIKTNIQSIQVYKVDDNIHKLYQFDFTKSIKPINQNTVNIFKIILEIYFQMLAHNNMEKCDIKVPKIIEYNMYYKFHDTTPQLYIEIVMENIPFWNKSDISDFFHNIENTSSMSKTKTKTFSKVRDDLKRKYTSKKKFNRKNTLSKYESMKENLYYKIVNALECIVKSGIYHNDANSDNILLYKTSDNIESDLLNPKIAIIDYGNAYNYNFEPTTQSLARNEDLPYDPKYFDSWIKRKSNINDMISRYGGITKKRKRSLKKTQSRKKK